ncbi:MAG: PQQ-binding-like beta-propeller repeat protein [Actinomycetota bacterium]|nr:PQQ-binding-like beta-propeller repeat protein [Actinomycetota bacterium]
MSEPEEILERIARGAPPPTEGFDGVRRRRRRREARRRAAALVVAVLVAVPGAWLGFRALSGLGGERAPSYPAIGPGNVSGISVVWQRQTGGLSGSSVTSDGTAVYVGTTSGTLVALDPVDGSEVWTTQLDGLVNTEPAAAGGRVYVHTSTGTLYAFPRSCRTTCEPLWTGQTGSTASTPPTVAAGSVYVVSNQGRLLAFPVDCGSGGAVCKASWVAGTDQHLPVQVAVSGDVVWDSSSTRLLPFAADCGTGGADCSPLTDGFHPATALSSPPAVSSNVVYVGGGDGSLYAVSTACSQDAGACRPLWVGRTGGAIVSAPVVAGDAVYVGSDDGRVYDFPALCRTDGGACQPTWFGRTGGPIGQSPAVTGGIVFVCSGDGIYAFSASAISRGKADPLVHMTLGSRTLEPVVWTHRIVLVPTRSGTLFALAGRKSP